MFFCTLPLEWSCVSYLCSIIIGHSDIIVVIVFLKPSQWSYYISAQKNWNCSELAEFPWFGDSSCDSYWSSRSGKSGVSGDLGDLDKSDGFSESGESIVSGNLVIIVILVILVLLVIMVILVILVIGNFIITLVSLMSWCWCRC